MDQGVLSAPLRAHPEIRSRRAMEHFGASFEANDPNMPSSESFIRNILLAQEFYKKGVRHQVEGYVPARLFRIQPGHADAGTSLRPDRFLDAEIVVAHRAACRRLQNPVSDRALGRGRRRPHHGGARAGTLFVERVSRRGSERQRGIGRKCPEVAFGIAYRYYGNKLANGAGDHGGSALPRSIPLLEEGITNGRPVQLVSATSSQLYEDYMPYGNHPELPVFVGEMPLDVHARAVIPPQAEMKRYNRRNEQLADAAERSAVIADWMGAVPYPKEALNDAWKRFLWHQFHDDLTGTSIGAAYTYSWNDEFLAQGQFCDVILASAGAAASVMDTRAKGSPVLVYNPAAYSRREPCRGDGRPACGGRRGGRLCAGREGRSCADRCPRRCQGDRAVCRRDGTRKLCGIRRDGRQGRQGQGAQGLGQYAREPGL